MAKADEKGADDELEQEPKKTTLGALDREQAATYLGVSHITVRKMQERGALKGFQDKDRKWWFTLEELDAHKKSTPESLLMDTARGMLNTANAHTEKMTGLSVDPMRAIFKMLRRDKRIDRKRIRNLEVDQAKMLKTFEEALSRSHERQMAQLDTEAKNRRMDKAMDRFLGFSPLITHWFAKKIGIKDEGRYEAIGSFLENFSPDEVMSMVQALPQEKQLVLMGLYQEFRERKDKAEASTNGTTETKPDTSTNGSTSPATETKPDGKGGTT